MKIEIRSANEAVISGYVNAVERESRVLNSPDKGKFVEVVQAKTFEKAILKGKPIELRFNHNQHLGSTSEENLEVYEDNIGLYATATVTDTDIISKAKNGELRGWSFTFIKNADTWETRSDGVQKRTLEDIDLLEVSILDKTPAYIGTSITSVEMRDEDATTITTEQRILEDIPEITTIETVTETTTNTTTTKESDGKITVNDNFTLIREREIEIIKLKNENIN